MKKLTPVLVIIFIIILIADGCGSTAGTTPLASSSQSTSTATNTPSSSTTSSTGPTYGSLSASGQSVFSANCAACHGAQGQGITGPALIGTGSSLSKYVNASMLLNFFSTSMPLTAPGSLSHQQYLDILCFLLVKNNDVTSSTAFDESSLGNVQIK